MNLIAAFLLGLAGSLHCAAMCGPLILAVQAARASTSQARGFLSPTLAYHFGRLLTYISIGALAGLLGAAVAMAGFQRWLSLAAGGVILLGTLAPWRAQFAGRAVSVVKAKFAVLLRRRSASVTILLGALNGLLPCGLVYVAAAAAAAAGSASGGAVTMAAFGAGTIPILASLGFAGGALRRARPAKLQRFVRLGGALAALLLIVRGLGLGLPYISPRYAPGRVLPCCHPVVAPPGLDGESRGPTRIGF